MKSSKQDYPMESSSLNNKNRAARTVLQSHLLRGKKSLIRETTQSLDTCGQKYENQLKKNRYSHSNIHKQINPNSHIHNKSNSQRLCLVLCSCFRVNNLHRFFPQFLFQRKNLHRFVFWYFFRVKNLTSFFSGSFSESRIVAQRFLFQSIFIDFTNSPPFFGQFLLLFTRTLS